MATEARGEGSGLVRRAGQTVATVFDDDAPAATRARAGAALSAGGVATFAGGFGAYEGIHALVVNPVASQILHSTAASDLGSGLWLGAELTVAAFAIGTTISDTASRDGAKAALASGHSAIGKVRTGCLLLGGAAAIAAGGFALTDGSGLTHLQAVDGNLVEAATILGTMAGMSSLGRLITRRYAAPKQAQLAE